jgi:hypothetical protein
MNIAHAVAILVALIVMPIGLLCLVCAVVQMFRDFADARYQRRRGGVIDLCRPSDPRLPR